MIIVSNNYTDYQALSRKLFEQKKKIFSEAKVTGCVTIDQTRPTAQNGYRAQKLKSNGYIRKFSPAALGFAAFGGRRFAARLRRLTAELAGTLATVLATSVASQPPTGTPTALSPGAAQLLPSWLS